MDHFNFFFILNIILILGVMACSPKSSIGIYSSLSDYNKVSFEGKELSLNSDGTFNFREWSDNYTIHKDQNGNIKCDDLKNKGVGKYRINKDSIELHFTNNDFLTCYLEINDHPSHYEVSLQMIDELLKPLIGGTVIVVAEDRLAFQSGSTDIHGKEYIKISKEFNPKTLNISSFASEEISIDLASNIGRSHHKIKRCLGYYANQDVEKMWFKTSQRFIQYKKIMVKL